MRHSGRVCFAHGSRAPAVPEWRKLTRIPGKFRNLPSRKCCRFPPNRRGQVWREDSEELQVSLPRFCLAERGSAGGIFKLPLDGAETLRHREAFPMPSAASFIPAAVPFQRTFHNWP